jgi:hypothetical protein
MSLEHLPARGRRSRAQNPFPDDDEVLSIEEWRLLNNLSPRTAARILAGPKQERPVIVRLSARRRGITRRANRDWQASRSR